jgi:Flavodoxin domain
MGSVLVAYASKYGSTKEVAEAIVATLREQGVDAVAQSAGEVTSLEGRSAVILGVALLYGFTGFKLGGYAEFACLPPPTARRLARQWAVEPCSATTALRADTIE